MFNSVLEEFGSLGSGQPVAFFGDIEPPGILLTQSAPPTDQSCLEDIGITAVGVQIDGFQRTELLGVIGVFVNGVIDEIEVGANLVPDQGNDVRI